MMSTIIDEFVSKMRSMHIYRELTEEEKERTVAERRAKYDKILNVLKESGENGMTPLEVALITGEKPKRVEAKLEQCYLAGVVSRIPEGNSYRYRRIDVK